MKTSLKVLALVLAISVPSAFAAELIGVPLPPMLDSLHVFAGFATTLVLLIAVGDYARPRHNTCTTANVGKAEHPLAA